MDKLEQKEKQLKRIGLFVDSFTEGGAERVMVTLANIFSQWGYNVDFLVVRDIGLYKDQLSPSVRKIVLYSGGYSSNIISRIKRKISLYFNLSRYFRRNPPDICMVTMRRENLIASRIYALSRAHFPLILREADSVIDEQIKTIRQMRYWYKKARCVIANSESTKNDLIEKIFLHPDQIKRIYNPMTLPEIKPKERNKKIQVLGCGRFVAKKNFSDLIKVMPLIREEYPDAELTIIGDGEERPKLEKLIKELGLEQAVHLPGLVSNPYDYYSRADVFAQTSLYEGFGYVLAESMACGSPVAAYDSHGAMREILDNGKYGELVPSGDL